jgi:hypothetical protein
MFDRSNTVFSSFSYIPRQFGLQIREGRRWIKNKSSFRCYAFDDDSNDAYRCNKRQNSRFRIGELNPGLVGTFHRKMIESDKS